MAAQRRRPRLLALTALVVLLLAQQAACSTLNTDQAGSDAGGKEADGGKKGGKDAAAAPAPQPARKKQPKAAAAPAPAPAAQDNSPSPSPFPSPSPSPEAAASPLPAQAYCAPGSGCVLFRLIMKVEGAPNPMSQLDASNVLAAVNSLAAPVVFEYRAQQPSAPGQLPAVDGATVKDPPVTKAARAAAAEGTAGTGAAATNGSDAAATDAAATDAAATDAAAAEAAAAAAGTSAAGQTAQRRLLSARRLGRDAALGARAGVSSGGRGLLQEAETANSCPKPKYQFEVKTAAECEEKCNLKVAGKTATVAPTTTTSASGGQLCCDCKYKKGTVPAATNATEATAAEEPSATQPAAANGTGWWPANEVTPPLTIDGVFLFMDAQVLSYGADPLAIKLLEASNTGQLCSTINEYGVNCDGTAIMFQGTGDQIVFVRNTQTTPPSSGSSSGGLTTAAIVGIVVGGVVALCAVAVLVHMVASCRRERIIERATRQRIEKRTASRKAASDAAAAAAAENSRWRQTYSDRMAESMRRADEALGRQAGQAHGPSFVEAQEREFARQASVQLSSKKSFGRSSSIKGSPKSDDLEQSIDGSLMAGSELSSPQPSVTSSAKGGRSLKNLFGKK